MARPTANEWGDISKVYLTQSPLAAPEALFCMVWDARIQRCIGRVS